MHKGYSWLMVMVGMSSYSANLFQSEYADADSCIHHRSDAIAAVASRQDDLEAMATDNGLRQWTQVMDSDNRYRQ